MRIIARRSGDTILRYVSDAPLESLRADLGLDSLPGKATTNLKYMACGEKQKLPAAVRARVQKLDDALKRLEGIVQTQAQDVVALATGYARTDNRIYVQNTATATIHTQHAAATTGVPFADGRMREHGLAAPKFRTALLAASATSLA